MGRRKIDIVRIENERHRQVTFTKRKSGLIKKATELAILCDAQVGVVIFGANDKMSIYSSVAMDDLLERHRGYKEPPEVRRLFRALIFAFLSLLHPTRIKLHTWAAC